MRKLSLFNQVSLDGYFTDENSDMSWAHKQDPEWMKFTEENAKPGGELVFGRKTYDMMKSFWPTEQAAKAFPEVAKQMNALPKIVFSRSMTEADWENARVINGDPAEEIKRLKNESGRDMVIMGSGTIVAQLSQAGLIDEFQIVVNPIVLGKGRTLFENIERFDLKLIDSRIFQNGNVVLTYQKP
jgi:dihydrofolate reductase